ncbi:uncharacterized protein C8Q71DRAFT_758357 [Rhodofomes roseus]|uniref:Uncharacterized protein n=1 Tax=Rhodofomes roseus TaxID=34475 RepID=A0ABQ8KFI1_9APHY|nr:uncharacterized protein C8Q71DRAFT_758357 [Rhodofomes roseus]KAH9836528.1 hypothetical protein C8Q71DRAFT_758357 [Rhodofomes roseus]
MEISSTIRILTSFHLSAAVIFFSERGTRLRYSSFFTFLSMKNIFSASCLASSFPRPIPAHECKVHPSMFIEAIPVAAVMARRKSGGSVSSSQSSASRGSLRNSSRKYSMIARRRTDFPVPAEPVKKMLFPDFTYPRTARCSADSSIPGERSDASSVGSSVTG